MYRSGPPDCSAFQLFPSDRRSGAGAVIVTGTPEGGAPVIRLSAASQERTSMVRGTMPAAAMRRVILRRWPLAPRVTMLPDSPARAVRPPRYR